MYPNTNVEVYVYSFGVGLFFGLGLLLCKLNALHANQPYQVPCKIKGALNPLEVPFHFLGKHKTYKHIDV